MVSKATPGAKPKPKMVNAFKEKVFHPNSRKAGQLERANLRKTKLASASSKRSKKQIEKADKVGFWFHALTPNTPALTLEELHTLVKEAWLPRHDEAISSEETLRRKGRPPSNREIELRALKERDAQEYRSGLEVPDLTHKPSVELFRQWNGDPAYLHLLRFIQISSSDVSSASITRYGLRERDAMSAVSVAGSISENMAEASMEIEDIAQDTLSNGFPGIPLTRFASTIQSMDSV